MSCLMPTRCSRVWLGVKELGMAFYLGLAASNGYVIGGLYVKFRCAVLSFSGIQCVLKPMES